MNDSVKKYNHAIDLLAEIAVEHAKEDKSLYPETTKQEEEVLSLLDEVIAHIESKMEKE